MGWIEKRPNKFLTQNVVRQGLPAKSLSVRFRFISLNLLRCIMYVYDIYLRYLQHPYRAETPEFIQKRLRQLLS
jgi:hypothetical protein